MSKRKRLRWQHVPWPISGQAYLELTAQITRDHAPPDYFSPEDHVASAPPDGRPDAEREMLRAGLEEWATFWDQYHASRARTIGDMLRKAGL